MFPPQGPGNFWGGASLNLFRLVLNAPMVRLTFTYQHDGEKSIHKMDRWRSPGLIDQFAFFKSSILGILSLFSSVDSMTPFALSVLVGSPH